MKKHVSKMLAVTLILTLALGVVGFAGPASQASAAAEGPSCLISQSEASPAADAVQETVTDPAAVPVTDGGGVADAAADVGSSVTDTFTCLFDIVKLLGNLAPDVIPVGVVLFALLSLLKWSGVVGNDIYAMIANAVLAWLSQGGMNVNTSPEVFATMGVSLVAAGSYQLWSHVIRPAIEKGIKSKAASG